MNAKYAHAAAPSGEDVHAGLSPFAIGLWLAVVLVGAKAVLLGAPQSAQWLVNLAFVTANDVLLALVLGGIGEVAVRITRWPAVRRAVRGVFVGVCVLCAFYAVAAVGVFEYFNRPLSYDLLRLARSVGAVRSSITEQLTTAMVIALVGVPVAFLALCIWRGSHRSIPKWLVVGAVIWIGAGLTMHATRPRSVFPRMELNPHFELMRSTVAGLKGAQPLDFPQEFPPEDALEFRPFAARAQSQRFDPPAGVARPRNVIVIVLESVGTKYLSLYGSPYATTPNLAAEAAHALVFDNFYAHASHTYHSFMALNFSIYPGLPWCHAPWAGRPCPPTLAALLQTQGWRTAYLHNGDLDWGSSRWLLEGHGYGIVEDYRNLGCKRLTSWGTEDRCVFERLVRWIDEQPAQPFFAICWTDQTHDPYKLPPGFPKVDFFGGNPPPQLAEELSRYLNVVRETDRQIGRLFAALRERGLAVDTLVVMTGDHGEAFRDPHDHRGHGFMIYQEDINVPLILWNPRLFSSGRRVPDVCAHVDVNPTIADVLGIEPSGEWQGYSLFDRARPLRAFFVTGAGDYHFGLREGPWKYVFEATDGQERLFDLNRDPKELQNVAASEPQRCARMRQRVAAWVSFEEEFLRGRWKAAPPRAALSRDD